MTQVQLLYRRPDGVTPGGVLITSGLVKISSLHRYDSSGGEMTTVAWTSALGATVTMDPGTWRFELYRVDNGRGGYLAGSDAVQHKLVPASGTFQVDDLTDVDPTTDSAVTSTPEWLALYQAQQAQIDSIVITGGGIPAPVDSVFTDATTFGKARIKDANAAAARTALGVAPLGTTAGTAADGSTVVHNTGNETVAGIKTFSSAPVVPDGSWSIADTSGLQAALDSAVAAGSVVASVHPTDPNVTVLTWA